VKFERAWCLPPRHLGAVREDDSQRSYFGLNKEEPVQKPTPTDTVRRPGDH